MARALTKAEMIDVLRNALRSVGNSPLLADGVSEVDLLAMPLDAFFASDENVRKLVEEIKNAFKSRGGDIVLGGNNVRVSAKFEDLLRAIAMRQASK